MGKLGKHITKRNLTNWKWWLVLVYVLFVISIIAPFAVIAFFIDFINDSFDSAFRFVDKKLSRSARIIEDWSRK